MLDALQSGATVLYLPVAPAGRIQTDQQLRMTDVLTPQAVGNSLA